MQVDADPPKHFSCNVAIQFDSARHAEIAERTLAVDEELQPQKICRSSSVKGETLHVQFAATELRLLRVALSTFYDHAILAATTLHEFG